MQNKNLKRTATLASIPLAVTLSFLPDNFLDNHLLSAKKHQIFPDTADTPRPSQQFLAEQKKVELIKSLTKNGYSEELAQNALNYAECASGLIENSYVWQHGQRRSGVFLISDSRKSACGLGNLDDWQFRALMQNETHAVRCRAILEKRGLLDTPLARCQQTTMAPEAKNLANPGKL